MSISARRILVIGGGAVTALGFAGRLAWGDPGGDIDMAVVGIVIYVVASFTVIRVPGNRVSWVLFAIALGLAFTNLAWLPGDFGWVLVFVGIFGLALPGLGVFLPLWFPSGSPPGPRWRWVEVVAWVALTLMAVSLVVGAVLGEANDDIDGCASVATCIELSSVILLLASIGASVVALIVRWFRAQGLERQQMKLTVLAFTLFAMGTIIEFAIEQDHPLGRVLFFVGSLLIPVAIGVAIVRYRLYDVDRIISRTVSYTVVIALLTGLVAVVAALVGSQFQEPLVVAATTLGVASIFNPLRRRVQAWVDRRFNRSRYDAERVMEIFVRSLRDRVDPDGVVDGWLGVVDETMRPESVGIWVRS